MCLSCFSNADVAITSGILGAASLRVGARQLLPRSRQRARPVADSDAEAFTASLESSAPAPAAADDPDGADPRLAGEGSLAAR